MTTTSRSDGPGGRYYTLPDGRVVPSVTTILSVIAKPALVAWAANQERTLCLDVASDIYLEAITKPKMAKAAFISTMKARLGKEKAHQRTSEKACNIGTQVHLLCEHALKKELGHVVEPPGEVSPEAMTCFQKFLAWRETIKLRPLSMEQTLWHKFGYAGTADLVCEVGGLRCVLDFKTSKGIYDEYRLQIAAYAAALDDMGHGPTELGCIARFPKEAGDAEFVLMTQVDMAEHFVAFRHAHALWKRLQGRK